MPGLPRHIAMMRMKRACLAVLLASTTSAGAGSAAAAAADPQPVTPFVADNNQDDPALSDAWETWQSKSIDGYVLTVRISCYCVPSRAVRTVVRNDTIRSVTQGEERLRPGKGYSMDELFTMLREASTEADRVEVDYTSRGVPKSIIIDPEQMAADEETYYAVSLTRLDRT